MISPEHRFVFKAELDRAIRAHLGLPPLTSTTEVARPQQAPPAPKLG